MYGWTGRRCHVATHELCLGLPPFATVGAASLELSSSSGRAPETSWSVGAVLGDATYAQTYALRGEDRQLALWSHDDVQRRTWVTPSDSISATSTPNVRVRGWGGGPCDRSSRVEIWVVWILQATDRRQVFSFPRSAQTHLLSHETTRQAQRAEGRARELR